VKAFGQRAGDLDGDSRRSECETAVGATALLRATSGQAADGQKEDDDVGHHAHFFDVEEIVGELLPNVADRRIVAVVDLRESGNAGFDEESLLVSRDHFLELLDEDGPFGPRSDEAHVAHQDVDQLRNFVEVRFAEDTADDRDARIVVARPDRSGLALGMLHHRADFEDREDATVFSDSLLAMECGTARREFHEDADDGQKRHENDQSHPGQDAIHDILHEDEFASFRILSGSHRHGRLHFLRTNDTAVTVDARRAFKLGNRRCFGIGSQPPATRRTSSSILQMANNGKERVLL
jgi:hypothetical protein